MTYFFFFSLRKNVFNYFVAFLLWKTCCPNLIVTFNIVQERFCQWWYYFHTALLPQEDYKMLLNCQTVYMHIQLKFSFCGFINTCTHSISSHWTLRDSSWMVKPCFPLKCIKGNPTVGQGYNFLAQSSGEPCPLGTFPYVCKIVYSEAYFMGLPFSFLVWLLSNNLKHNSFSTAWICMRDRSMGQGLESHPIISYTFRISF